MKLVAFDIGNTHTVIGLFDGGKLSASWRMKTDALRTDDETHVLLRSFFQHANLSLDAVNDAAICSVVPPALPSIVSFCKKVFGKSPLVVGAGIKTGVIVRYENPKEVGADRIVNAVAGIERYPLPLVIIDFGTATTFDCISKTGEYLGGAIVPGVGISAEALFQRASKLPRVEIARPPQVLGRTTVQSIQSGLLFGTVSMVEGMLTRLEREMGEPVTAVTTGGLGGIVAEESSRITEYNPDLTLYGLWSIYEKNLPHKP